VLVPCARKPHFMPVGSPSAAARRFDFTTSFDDLLRLHLERLGERLVAATDALYVASAKLSCLSQSTVRMRSGINFRSVVPVSAAVVFRLGPVACGTLGFSTMGSVGRGSGAFAISDRTLGQSRMRRSPSRASRSRSGEVVDEHRRRSATGGEAATSSERELPVLCVAFLDPEPLSQWCRRRSLPSPSRRRSCTRRSGAAAASAGTSVLEGRHLADAGRAGSPTSPRLRHRGSLSQPS